jgi:hypothetical protein
MLCIVAYSLKARIVESQQPDVTRQQPINNRGMVFSAQSILMAAHARIKYVIPLLSNNCSVTGTVFSTQSMLRCYKHYNSVSYWRKCCGSVHVSCCCEKLVAEARDSWGTQRIGNIAVGSCYQATASECCNRLRKPSMWFAKYVDQWECNAYLS